MRTLFAMLLVVLLSGCRAVVSPTPFGLEPAHIDVEALTGIWEGEDDEEIIIAVHDESKGLVDVSFREPSDAGQPAWRTVRVHFMRGNEWHFLSMPRCEEGSSRKGYVFACYKFTPGRIIVWGPDIDRFEGLVRDGKIAGRIENGDVFIGEVTPELIDIIESEKYGVLFDWREPGILRKRAEAEVEPVPEVDAPNAETAE